MLAALILNTYHDARGNVLQDYSRVRLVSVLSSRTRTTDRVVFDVLRINANLGFGWLWQHRDCDSAGVDPAPLFTRRDSLPTMAPCFVLEDFLRLFADGAEDEDARTVLYDLEVKDPSAT